MGDTRMMNSFKADHLPKLANILECNINDLFFNDTNQYWKWLLLKHFILYSMKDINLKSSYNK